MRVPRRFVDCINARDLSGLRKVLSDRCRIIDARGDWMEGRDTVVEAMEKFFAIEPEYRLHVSSMGRSAGNVLINGHATARDPRFSSSTIWRARADGTHLHEWQSYSPQPGAAVCRLLVGDKAQMGPFLEGAQ